MWCIALSSSFASRAATTSPVRFATTESRAPVAVVVIYWASLRSLAPMTTFWEIPAYMWAAPVQSIA